jgi:hypothetical protein
MNNDISDLLEQICEMLGIDQDGGADWVLGELHDRLKSDAEKIRSADAIENLLRHDRTGLIEVNAELRPWYAAARECAEAMGVTTPEELIDGAKALATMRTERDAVERKLARVLAGELQHLASQALPESKPHRVKQAGGRDLGVLVGYVTEWGLFRVTEGVKTGAVYGCLYSAEPVERTTRPALGEPCGGDEVWVRTNIDIATGSHIYLECGGHVHRSRWTPDYFARATGTTTHTDDLPF